MRKRQYVIYLDQFSVSEMVFGKGIWETIRTLLVNAVESGKVICPIPLEHFIETAGLERNKAIQQDLFFKSISHGRSFYPWEYIAANEIILYTKFKKNKRILASFIRDLNGDYDLENEATYQKHRQIREEFLSKKDKDVLNYIRQLSRDNNGANVDKASLSKEEKKERRRQRNKLEANMEIMKEALAFHNVKPYIDDTFRRVGIEDKPGIYKITNLDNGKAYIGKSTNIKKRLADHFKASIGLNSISWQAVHDEILKLGFWNWTIEVVTYCDKEQLNELEKYYIDFFKTQEYGYNRK